MLIVYCACLYVLLGAFLHNDGIQSSKHASDMLMESMACAAKGWQVPKQWKGMNELPQQGGILLLA